MLLRPPQDYLTTMFTKEQLRPTEPLGRRSRSLWKAAGVDRLMITFPAAITGEVEERNRGGTHDVTTSACLNARRYANTQAVA